MRLTAAIIRTSLRLCLRFRIVRFARPCFSCNRLCLNKLMRSVECAQQSCQCDTGGTFPRKGSSTEPAWPRYLVVQVASRVQPEALLAASATLVCSGTALLAACNTSVFRSFSGVPSSDGRRKLLLLLLPCDDKWKFLRIEYIRSHPVSIGFFVHGDSRCKLSGMEKSSYSVNTPKRTPT
jgi:hypothetical protein